MFELVCICYDGENTDYKIERNIYSPYNSFSTIQEAWERNDDMGSRWILYPIRVIVKDSGDREGNKEIVSVCDGMPKEIVGMTLDTLIKNIIDRNYDEVFDDLLRIF